MSGAPNTLPIRLKTVEVIKALQEGEKFIKWDEDSTVGVPVTLRVDPKGFYLYWTDQNLEIDLLDIATIRDVRTGHNAKIPKDPKLKNLVTIGSQGTLDEKTVTVCYGTDFVNVSFINFCCAKTEIAQVWTEELFKLSYNLSQTNNPTIMFLHKVHTKLSLMTDKSGKILIKNIVRLFAQNKEDKKRVEKALSESGLPTAKSDTINPSKFQFEDFFSFYKNLTQRTEIQKIFHSLADGKNFLTTTQFVEFLNQNQRDPRLNEILHPYADAAHARDLIQQYETNKFHLQRGQLTFDGFLRFLMSEDNCIVAANKLELCDDMEHPMSHYFINSSHNTYLTGHQITGKSSVEIYRQVLLAGCRCVELDFWNGKIEEPAIVHGYTLVPEISAKEVLEAIAESAFKTSEFPVILSFENHCSPKQQAKIAHYCREIFGEMLLDKPLDSHQLEPGGDLPPPSMLCRKIIIKNKKMHHHHHHHHKKSAAVPATEEPVAHGNGDIVTNQLQLPRQGSKESTASSDSDSSSDDEVGSTAVGAPLAEEAEAAAAAGVIADKAQQARESEAGAEISALVNYVQPVRFSSFENSEKKNRFYEMSSFDEKQATTLLKERPIEFVNYNKSQLSRVYPSGTRFDSSNFMPQVFWNAGCQLVALNYQTLDLAMQLNLGTFEYNRRCGYLLKPEFMRRKDRRLDPFAESTVDGIIACTMTVTILSGQLLTDKRTGTYVEVDMYGLPADTVRKRYRTKVVRNNGLNPIYGEDPFVFKKVVLPDLASVRLAAYEEGGRLLGHRVLPVVGLCPGYRHVNLRTELGQPLTASIFLLIVVKDYVPDGLSELAEALANPIKYQSELEKREQQLAVLTDDMETIPTAEEVINTALNRRELPAPQKQSSIPNSSDASIMAGRSPKQRASLAGLPHQPSLTVSLSNVPALSAPNISQDEAVSSVVGVVPELAVQEPAPRVVEGVANEADAITPEPLEVIMECKAVREKRADLRRKLDGLLRKHEKERRALETNAGMSMTKFYISNKLVKRLSARNIESTPSDAESSVTEENGGAMTSSSMESPLAALAKEHAAQIHELKERFHNSVYTQADKYLKQSQQSQLKYLQVLLDRETRDVMRRLQEARRGEVKALAKVHKDRDELVRIKRELDSQMVDKGVHERIRLTEAYERRREHLTRQHERVRQQLTDHREQAKLTIDQEYENSTSVIESETGSGASNKMEASSGE